MTDIDQHASPLSSLGSSIGLSGASTDKSGGNLGIGLAEEDWVPTPRVRATSQLIDKLQDCVRLCIFNTDETTVDEAWSELFAILPFDKYRCIVKLQRVTNASVNPRIDMWVRGDLGASLVRYLREMTRQRTPSLVGALKKDGSAKDWRHTFVTSRWRFAIWQSWRDRRVPVIPSPAVRIEMAIPKGFRLATLNINGFPSKRDELIQFLEEEQITVLALQETLVSLKQYPIKVPGFKVFAQNWQEGFRGQAVLVKSHLPAYMVPHVKEKLEGYKYLLHVKVSRIPGLPGKPRSLHFVGVYLPSGGSVRSLRAAGFSALAHLYEGILRNDCDAMIVAMGDFNEQPNGMRKRLERGHLKWWTPRGSSLTRFPVRGPPTSLDHMLCSPIAMISCLRPRVLRQWAMSDHRPLISDIRMHIPSSTTGTPWTKVRYNRRRLAKYSFELVNDNRWLALLDLEDDSLQTLSHVADELSSTLRTVTVDYGVRVDSGSSPRVYFPNRLKRLLQNYRRESEALAAHLTYNAVGDVPKMIVDHYKAVRLDFRKAYKAWRRREQSKHYARIAEDFLVHDHRNVWSRLKSQMDAGTRVSDDSQPVRNKAGVLCVDDDSILESVKEHYMGLAQDDVDGTSRSEEHWDSMSLGDPLEELEGLNHGLAWSEVIVAIRGMNRDTAPGVDDMHINLLKAMVGEESMLVTFGPDKGSRPDETRVAISRRDFPEVPLSPLGKALWKVLRAIWALENIPDKWNEVVIVNLFKKGDPELLVNYRGLSLISVSLKVLLVLMVHRLEKTVESKALHLSRCQSGFRKREEAIAQFLVMAEIVRRRHLANAPTFGVFLDLQKAYDRVPHGALYRILKHRGVRGKFLALIKALYNNSQMSVRACGKLAAPFSMWRGLRQGCPLSPLLFIIFIDHCLEETRPVHGLVCQVPANRGRAGSDGSPNVFRSCGEMDGGMYADDIVFFESSLEQAQQRCANFVEWGKKWGMAVNFQKSGVMLWSFNEHLRKAFNDWTFVTPEGTFPKVASYKYLGIEVTDGLPLFMGSDSGNLLKGERTDAQQHARSQAAKGLNTLSMLKPVLCDRLCPLSLKVELIRTFAISVMAYGGELLGFNKQLAMPMQRVIDLAVRWSVGLKKSNKLVSSLALCIELGLPLFYELLAGQRARLYDKLLHGDPPMMTWLPLLQQDHHFHPFRTWCSENEHWLKTWFTARNRESGWDWVSGGANKFAPWSVVPTDLFRERLLEMSDDQVRVMIDPDYETSMYRLRADGTLDDDNFRLESFNMRTKVTDAACKKVLLWWLEGRPTESPFDDLTLDEVKLSFIPSQAENVAPVRPWYALARIAELHRRSNRYTSPLLQSYRSWILGVDHMGRVLVDPHDLNEDLMLLYLKHFNSSLSVAEARRQSLAFLAGSVTIHEGELQAEREFQDVVLGGKRSMDSAPDKFIRQVKECALERLMSVDGGRSATFSGWYDKFQFGATRDYLRLTLGRPDLLEGVRLLALVRTGAFPRASGFGRGQNGLLDVLACPLCGGRVEVGWDWIHLAMTCHHRRVVSARKRYLSPAIKFLLSAESVRLFYNRWPDIPDSVRGLPYQSLQTDQHAGLLNLRVAIYLAGGCLFDPRENTYLLSFGQSDIVLTGLGNFGFAFMASFLQEVGPIYSRALGLNPRITVPLEVADWVRGILPHGRGLTINEEGDVGLALPSPVSSVESLPRSAGLSDHDMS